MQFLKQKIQGVFIIKKKKFIDKRGIFMRHFCKETFKIKNLTSSIQQSNLSINYKKGTLRGFHYQEKPFQEDKIMSCIKGKMYDVVIDMRKNSKTYRKWLSFEISEKNQLSLLIPKGCANAFLTLTDDTIIHYYCSQKYNPKYEKGINFQDPFFSFKWPIKPRIFSKKDFEIPYII